MKQLQYERLNQLLLVADWRRDFSSEELISSVQIPEGEYLICFSDYVKSQVHLNIVSKLYSRSLAEYVQAFYYLQGEKEFLPEALRVLKYFYLDMAFFLINNPVNVSLYIEVDVELGRDKTVDIWDIEEQLRESNLISIANKITSVEQLSEFEQEISKIITSVSDLESKPNNYILAFALMKAAKSKENEKIVMKGKYRYGKDSD